jgi:hypothetical protein
MSLKLGLGAALLLAASSAAAQPPAAAPPAPTPTVSPEQRAALQSAATAFGQCVSAGIQRLSASVAPEAGATIVLGGCAAQRGALAQSVEAIIAIVPDAQRPAAQAQFESQMGQAEAQTAEAIRQARAAPPAPAAPAAPPH